MVSKARGCVADQDSGSPLVLAITAKIAAMIRDGVLASGHVLPSERELARNLSTSRQIIRAATKELANQGLIEAKPRCRPVVVSGQAAKRAHRSSGRRHIAIWLWPNTSDYAAASILRGIQSSDLGEDVRLLVANAVGGDWDSIFDSEASFLRSVVADPEEAGVIVWYLSGERNVDCLNELRKAGVPTVFVDRLPPEGFSADFVGTDNESAARKAVQHLLDLGHRRIALLTNIEKVSSVRDREAGYRRSLRDAGIQIRDDYIVRDLVDGPEGVETALDALLGLDEPPTAIFCVNDHMALQVYEALQDRKISVPQQMSVVGFDGLLRWVPGGGYLTTLLQDFERMGQLAAEIVIERMSTGTPDAFKHLMLDAPLAERGSTAPPPIKDQYMHSHISSKEKQQ